MFYSNVLIYGILRIFTYIEFEKIIILSKIAYWLDRIRYHDLVLSLLILVPEEIDFILRVSFKIEKGRYPYYFNQLGFM